MTTPFSDINLNNVRKDVRTNTSNILVSEQALANLDGSVVKKTEDQTIAGVKTFDDDVRLNDDILVLGTSKALRMSSTAKIVIGKTTEPDHSYPLLITTEFGDIEASSSNKFFNRTHTSLGSNYPSAINNSVSIATKGSIMSNDYFWSSNGSFTSSDSRIKKDIIDCDDIECLNMLREIQPKKYKYKDYIDRGDKVVYGFIAQDISNIIPDSVTQAEDKLPNIYQLCDVSNGNVIDFADTSFNVIDMIPDLSNILSLVGADGQYHDVSYTEIDTSSNSITLDKDITEWLGAEDGSGNMIDGSNVFVYGQRVNDFNILKKDAIWTITTSAVQEIDRQQQLDKQEIADLKARLTVLENK
jgi:hypothetical protein